jgi:hypothetical protein
MFREAIEKMMGEDNSLRTDSLYRTLADSLERGV